MRTSGLVVEEAVSPGSKSARRAILLRTKRRDYVLRRLGANPFEPGDLRTFVGARVRVEGTLAGTTLLATSITKVDEAEEA